MQLFVKTAYNTQLLLAFGFFCWRGVCCLVVAKDDKQGQYKKKKERERSKQSSLRNKETAPCSQRGDLKMRYQVVC